MTKFIEESKAMIAATIDQINTFKSSPTQKDSPKPPELTNVVTYNSRDPPLDGGYSTEIGGMWTMKHEISSPILYEFFINT